MTPGAQDLDRPAPTTPVELVLVTAAWSLPAVVVSWDDEARAGVLQPEPLPEDDLLVFRPDGVAGTEPAAAPREDPFPDPPAARSPAELFWLVAGRLRVAPAQVAGVDRVDGVPRWTVRMLGETADGQRREAVRAMVAWPVTVTIGDDRLTGETVDVSETGLRARLRPEGGAGRPRRRQAVDVALRTTRGELVAPAQIRRVQETGAPWEWAVSVRFAGLSQASAEVVRREVRAGLADLDVPGHPRIGHPLES